MDMFTAIENRYSHKESFLSDPVPPEDLEKIAKAGLAAPSGVNRQTVKLVILPDRVAVKALFAVASTQGIETAPAAIAVFTDQSLCPADGISFEKEDYSAAVENMLLAITALGYASLWLDSPFYDPKKQQAAKDLLSAPKEAHLWAVLPIGKPDGPGSRREKLPYEARLWYNRYGG